MTDIPISQLPDADALTTEDLFPIVQSGITKKAPWHKTTGYKVYTALLSQTGTNAPTATVLQNTLGHNVTWSRVQDGQYLAMLDDSSFPAETVILHGSLQGIGNNGRSIIQAGYNAGVSGINLVTYLLDLTDPPSLYKADDLLALTTVEFRIY